MHKIAVDREGISSSGVDFKGAGISALTQGNLMIAGSRNLFGLVKVGSSADSYSARHQTALVTSVQSQGDVLSHSEGDTELVGTRIRSSGGKVNVLAGHDVKILATYDTHEVSESHQSSQINFAAATRTRTNDTTTSQDSTAVVAELSGQNQC